MQGSRRQCICSRTIHSSSTPADQAAEPGHPPRPCRSWEICCPSPRSRWSSTRTRSCSSELATEAAHAQSEEQRRSRAALLHQLRTACHSATATTDSSRAVAAHTTAVRADHDEWGYGRIHLLLFGARLFGTRRAAKQLLRSCCYSSCCSAAKRLAEDPKIKMTIGGRRFCRFASSPSPIDRSPPPPPPPLLPTPAAAGPPSGASSAAQWLLAPHPPPPAAPRTTRRRPSQQQQRQEGQHAIISRRDGARRRTTQ